MEMRLSGGTRRSGCPERAQIHRGVARLPAPQEALDGRMQHHVVELGALEEPVAADGRVLRRRCFERAAREIAGEDDVDDVLGREGTLRRDRVDDRDRPFDGNLVLDPDLLAKLAVERVGEALPGVHTAARQEPVVASPGFLVLAQEDAVLPPQHGGHTDARLERHHTADEPNPRTPRSLAGSSSTSTGSTPGTCRTTSCAIRIPGSTTKRSCGSVLWRITLSSPR